MGILEDLDGCFDDREEVSKFDERSVNSLDGEVQTYEGVEVLKESAKGYLVRFPLNPKPHWCAKSQCELDADKTTIRITQWLIDTWQDEEGFSPDEPSKEEGVSIKDVLCVRETEAALWVDVPEFGRTWIPKSQLVAPNEIGGDGDEGTLVVTQWIYDQKFSKKADTDDAQD